MSNSGNSGKQLVRCRAASVTLVLGIAVTFSAGAQQRTAEARHRARRA
jgi:hypothetical protein